MVGQSIAHYRILEKLGEGGMGVVYKARDTHLDRFVAIKVLPPERVADPERKRRFVQEAKAASALNHPNIITIHDIARHQGVDFMVMEYVPGKTLDQLIRRKGLPLGEALKYAAEIADALATAHGAGIVHRDVKPSNVMVTEKGRVKVLDFGLAKLTEPVAAGEEEPTRTLKPRTQEGMILGTVAYMSPEQAEGKKVDARSDIFSFGALLYEMVTGQRAFQRDTKMSTLAAIINEEPKPLHEAAAGIPSELERIITRCLRKDAAKRWQTMADLNVALEELREESESRKLVSTTAGARTRRTSPLLLAGMLLVALALLAALNWRGLLERVFGGPATPRIESLAVLPLANLSGDPQQQYFSDGMHEALITELSRIKAIKVISRTSVMGYKGTKKRIPEIARELGVAAIVEGSTIHSGNLVRINVQLIDGRSDKHLWADNFDREYRDILALQSEAALAIAKQIQATLTPQEAKILARTRPVNPDAYQAYLKGMFLLGTLSDSPQAGPDVKKSIQYFEQARTTDPNFALAYAGVALAYDYYGSFGVAPPKETAPKAVEAASKALSLDDSLADPHLVLADLKFCYEWDFDGAEREFRRFFELNPNHALGHALYAVNLAATGRGKEGEAILHADRARELDPLTYTTGEYVIAVYSLSHRYDRALALAKELLSLHPNNSGAHRNLGNVYIHKGLFGEALAEYQKSIELGAPPDSGWLATMYARSGEKVKARQFLNDLLRQSKEKDLNPAQTAQIYSLLGEKDKAFEWLERAYEQRSAGIPTTKVGPFYDNLRSDPRFTALLKRIGLEK